jgi:hypothetical protein
MSENALPSSAVLVGGVRLDSVLISGIQAILDFLVLALPPGYDVDAGTIALPTGDTTFRDHETHRPILAVS